VLYNQQSPLGANFSVPKENKSKMPDQKGESSGGTGGSGSVKQRVLVGVMEPYTLGEDFDAYLHRFNNYLELNGVTDNTYKVQLLTNLIGPTASQKIYKACRPKEPKQFEYDEIVQKCKNIFQGERWSIAEHYRFNKRDQHEGESAQDYAIELQAIGEHCAFGDFRDTALRDRFVAGIRCSKIKAKLLNEAKDSKFEKIVQMAVNAEMIDENVRAMGPRSEVHFVRSRQSRWSSRRRSPSSSRFHRYNHSESRSRSRSGSRGNDRFRKRYTDENRRCYNCNKYGHLANNCRAKKDEFVTKRKTEETGDFKRAKSRVQYCDSEGELKIGNLKLSDPSSSDSTDSFVNSIKCKEDLLINVVTFLDNQPVKKETLTVLVEDKRITLEVDTGSCATILSLKDYLVHFRHLKLEKINWPLTAINGGKLKVVGRISVNVEHRGEPFVLSLVIVDCQISFQPLLGRDWLDILYPSWRKFFNVNSLESGKNSQSQSEVVTNIKNSYTTLFDNDLSSPVIDFKADIQLIDNAKPIFCKAYTLPFKLRDAVGTEIDNLCANGILKPIKRSVWASPIVVVTKPDKNIRVCVDFSVTINKQIKTEHYPLPVIDEVLANLGGSKYFCVLDMKGAYTQLEVMPECQEY
jgi:Zinc knuckle